MKFTLNDEANSNVRKYDNLDNHSDHKRIIDAYQKIFNELTSETSNEKIMLLRSVFCESFTKFQKHHSMKAKPFAKFLASLNSNYEEELFNNWTSEDIRSFKKAIFKLSWKINIDYGNVSSDLLESMERTLRESFHSNEYRALIYSEYTGLKRGNLYSMLDPLSNYISIYKEISAQINRKREEEEMNTRY